MEQVLKHINTVRVFRSGPLGPYLQQFAESSHRQRYARESIQVQLRAIGRFGRWLKISRITLRNLQQTHAQRYLRHNGDVRQGDARTLQRFLELLPNRASTSCWAALQKRKWRSSPRPLPAILSTNGGSLRERSNTTRDSSCSFSRGGSASVAFARSIWLGFKVAIWSPLCSERPLSARLEARE